MLFEWDPRKARINVAKHRVSFEEACTIFADESILSLPQRVAGEERWVSMGMSERGRVLVVVHLWRDSTQGADELVRLVSARRANRNETDVYLERRR